MNVIDKSLFNTIFYLIQYFSSNPLQKSKTSIRDSVENAKVENFYVTTGLWVDKNSKLLCTFLVTKATQELAALSWSVSHKLHFSIASISTSEQAF